MAWSIAETTPTRAALVMLRKLIELRLKLRSCCPEPESAPTRSVNEPESTRGAVGAACNVGGARRSAG